ncbi:MAG TPA: hypothetical protein DGG94_04305 [Micromonosporaceae bacterium]|nr:hypothetical protein [Micromonosporaceae bacterium]HCU49021.1 hypothetical protein [Micromonosporaceae bacterium]
MSTDRVPVEDIEKHYGLHRWHIEKDPSNWFGRMSLAIAKSPLDRRDQVVLTNTCMAVASFARAHNALVANVRRFERALNEGVTPIEKFLTGSSEAALHVLFLTSLWMDLSDTLVWYRSIADRLSHLRNGVRARRVFLTDDELNEVLDTLNVEVVAELSPSPLRDLANNLLHQSWHPSAQDVGLHIFRRSTHPITIDFSEQGDTLESLGNLVEETRKRIETFVGEVVKSAATRSQKR